jgi:feruloyl esterase
MSDRCKWEDIMYQRASVYALLAFLVAILSARPMGQAPVSRPTGSVDACANLRALSFEGNTSITAATRVTSGTLAVSNEVTIVDLPPFCRVQGVSKPSADSNIVFEVWLPEPQNWNAKFLSSGEGGFAGTLNYSRNGNAGGLDDMLRRGYATASTDTGHRSSDSFWAVGHPERTVDYLYRAKHLVTVAAKGLITAYYTRPASRSYFNSCSNGGRQGLLEAQRYPEDFDGIVAGAPWNFQSHSNAGFVWNTQAIAAPESTIPPEKLPAINAAALEACDANDGLKDGIIANPPACRFDPSVLLCRGPETDACLTKPQVTALQKIYEGPRNRRTGEAIFPGFAVGSELSWTNILRDRSGSNLSNGYFSNLVFENPKWDFHTFDFDADMTAADGKIGRVGNAVQVDYSAAKRRGVKILQYHGWNDPTLQPAYSPETTSRSPKPTVD